jgi:hypothetical protein
VLITVGFIILVAWASVVLVAASHHGRPVRRVHCIAVAIGVVGALLVMPGLLIGNFGLPASWSYRWLGFAGRLGYAGLALVVFGAGAWLLLDTAFIWRERRRVVPFVFRRRRGSEG